MREDLRYRFSTLGESVVEWTIRLCGWSAILFVFAIFVFREGAPVLCGKLDLKEFFTSVNWRPDSTIRPQFGILALLARTASVTALAMAISVPAGFASAIFISEFCGSKAREALKIIIEVLAAIPSGIHRLHGLEPGDHLGHRRSRRRRRHPAPNLRSDDERRRASWYILRRPMKTVAIIGLLGVLLAPVLEMSAVERRLLPGWRGPRKGFQQT